MITVDEAFGKFKSRLELSKSEQQDASRRQNTIREFLRGHFDIDRDFLTGSYARHTKTKPLKDVDIFIVLGDEEGNYRTQTPEAILVEIQNSLGSKYGEDKVSLGRRSVKVDFGVNASNNSADGQVMSMEVVPSFSKESYFEIPDRITRNWIPTDPEVHAELATNANQSFSEEWKPLVKMIKKWNETKGKPVKPSFLIEVMALDLFVPPFGGGYPYELKGFFASAEDRISEIWNDPAGLGPPVSDQMVSSQIIEAQRALDEAEEITSRAIRLSKNERQGDALRAWRELFGSLFPLS